MGELVLNFLPTMFQYLFTYGCVQQSFCMELCKYTALLMVSKQCLTADRFYHLPVCRGSISFEIGKSLCVSSSIPLLITLFQEICLFVNSVKRHTDVVVVLVEWPTCHKEQTKLAQTSSVARVRLMY